MKVLVDVADVRAVLAVVPPWVPEGWHGDSAWTPESLEAKERLASALATPITPILSTGE